MTVTHIIERLERLKSFEKCPYPIFITKEDSEVLDLAIKAIEAWGEVADTYLNDKNGGKNANSN